jgi:hypothetical protein
LIVIPGTINVIPGTINVIPWLDQGITTSTVPRLMAVSSTAMTVKRRPHHPALR